VTRLRLVLASALVVVLTSCGASGTPAGRALRDTAKNLDDIRSARLDLRLAAESSGAKGPVGFSLSGPFSLPSSRGLPVADLKVTELRGRRSSTVRFVSTGQAAYVVSGGRTSALPGNAGVDVGGESGRLGTLRIDHWLRDPRLARDGEVDRVTAGLEVATAFDDLGRLGEKLGASALAGLKPLDADARARLDRSARDATIEVVTGHDDRLLRRLVLHVTLTAAGSVPPSLGSLVPVTLSLSLDLADVNQPVHVDAPAG
jgi:hypothetical protein